jgi:hypothetical protein
MFMKWVRSQIGYRFGHFLRRRDERACHRGGHVEHMHALWLQPNRGQQVLDAGDTPLGICITFQVMAVAGQSTGGQHAVCPVLERAQDR